MINVCIGALGWEGARTAAKVEGIYDTLLNVFRIAETGRISTSRAADQLAEARLGIGPGQEGQNFRIVGTASCHVN
ncbi:MAG: hypothetical protein LC803_10360 [Acidobacteria bacterium]|nr:hypothetical protein [Acidobacteriota bacterium]